MPIAEASSSGMTGSSTQVQTCPVPSGLATGDLLIACVYAFSSGAGDAGAIALSDNGVGSVWSSNRVNSGFVTRNRVVMGDTIVGATPPSTITVTMNTAAWNDIAMALIRCTGSAASGFFDAGIGNSQTSATPVTGTLTTTNANDIIICALTHDGATTTLVAPSGFSQAVSGAGNSTNTDATTEPYASGWEVVAATQNQTYQWTLGASRNAVMAVGAWKALAVAGVSIGWIGKAG